MEKKKFAEKLSKIFNLTHIQTNNSSSLLLKRGFRDKIYFNSEQSNNSFQTKPDSKGFELFPNIQQQG